MGDDSYVGAVNSNDGQGNLDRTNGNANGNDGVGLSVGLVIARELVARSAFYS